MSDIQYKAAKTVREAAGLMAAAKGKGRILAGGTDLLVQMKSGTATPGVIVDVKKIPEMVSITETKGSFTIGAATPADGKTALGLGDGDHFRDLLDVDDHARCRGARLHLDQKVGAAGQDAALALGGSHKAGRLADGFGGLVLDVAPLRFSPFFPFSLLRIHSNRNPNANPL